MGILRYERAPSREFQDALQGALAFLLDPQLRVGGRALDPQFREGDRLMLYTGSTCVLVIQYRKGGRLTFTAADSYKRQHTTCAQGHYSSRAVMPAMSSATACTTSSRHRQGWTRRSATTWTLSSSTVSGWTKRAQCRCARAWCGGATHGGIWTEKECLAAALSPPEVKSKVEEAWRDLLGTPAFAKRRPAKPQDLQDARAQDELDQLGIDGKGRLVLAELKYGGVGSNAAFIYAAPLQLLRYAWAWDVAIQDPELRRGLQRLLDAKRTLFPAFYEGCPASVGDGLRAVIAFGDGLRCDRKCRRSSGRQ